MPTDVVVPTLGESVTEATVGEWLKQPGDAVEADEIIASLETDKVAVEVPAPSGGVIAELLAGGNVKIKFETRVYHEGDLLLEHREEGGRELALHVRGDADDAARDAFVAHC